MNVHLKHCIAAACGVVVSILLGLYVSPRMYLVATICLVWCVYHLFSWLGRTPVKSEPTFGETFKSFYDDGTDKSSTKKG